MKNHIIVGTAGHIDHGKTALIKALTGYDADRLKEEKERGITIELGFTYFDLPDGRRVGIVDVPGHERFIHTMAAGASGMDLVLLVVDVCEGVMPQTREHLDIVQLLGVKKLLVALTKCDLADAERRRYAAGEVRTYLKETAYPDAAIVPVSARTGEGLGQLVREIAVSVDGLQRSEESPVGGVFRLPIDRVFSLAGQGTVVTGTLLGGTIKKGQEAWLYPSEEPVRVRNLQVHGQDVAEADAGQRVAANLSGLSKDHIRRGSVLGTADAMHASDLLDVRVYMLEHTSRRLESGMRLHVCIGTAHILGRVAMLEKPALAAGEDGLAQLRLESPVASCSRDRCVLRFYSPMETIAGGVVVDSCPGRKEKAGRVDLERLYRLETGGLAARLEEAVFRRGFAPGNLEQLAKDCACTVSEVREALDTPWLAQRVQPLASNRDLYVCHQKILEELRDGLLEDLREYHRENPYRPGAGLSGLYSCRFTGFTWGAWLSLLDIWTEAQVVCRRSDILSLAGFSIKKDARYTRIANQTVNALQKAGPSFLRLRDIPYAEEDRPWAADVAGCLEAKKTIVCLEGEYYTLDHLRRKMQSAVEARMRETGKITIVDMRGLLGTTRKNAKIFLSYLDQMHVTRKEGAESERVRYGE